MARAGEKTNYLGQAWLVIVLAVFYGGALATVQTALSGKIAENKKRETYDVIPALVPGAEVSKTAEVVLEGEDGDEVWAYQVFSADGAHAGWVVPTSGQGFADRIELLVGLDAECSVITGIYVLGQKETPGLGDYITGEEFRNRFRNKPTVRPLEVVKAEPAAESEIRELTGATISSESVSGKNTFISKDANEYLWSLSSRQTGSDPDKYDLVAYISDDTDSISSGWTEDTTFLSPDTSIADLRGSILPTGTGSDVWAVYNHDSHVDSMKRTSGSWGSEENVYTDTGSLEFIVTAPACAVIDGNGVLHVVYGDATKSGATEYPQIQYKYRSSSGWSSALELDADATNVGHNYPTVSLETSTGDLYVFWISLDDNNIDCKKNDSGSWSFVTLGGQNSNEKHYLTSIYSVSGENYICWQWTQNTTGDIEVIFDVIPEFEDLVVPILVMIAIFFVGMRKRRHRLCIDG